MSVKVVSYDLRKPETSEDYKKLISHLKSYYFWAKPLESFWLLETSKSCAEVRDEIKKYVDENDKVFVTPTSLSGWASYGLPKDVIDWLNAR